MSVSTLTDTRWKFNTYINNIITYHGSGWMDENITITINFTIENDNKQYIKMYMWYYRGGGTQDEALYIYDQNNQYYNLESSLRNKIVTFTSEPVITGNSGKSVSDFITWLENNAVLQVDPCFIYGNNVISHIYLGGSLVQQIYYGSTLIYEDQPDNIILDVTGGVIKASDGFLITTENAPTPTLISFTYFSSTTLQAEEGMTWAEWIESEYNTVGWTNQGTYIRTGALELWFGNGMVLPQDTIINNGAYYGSGGGSN